MIIYGISQNPDTKDYIMILQDVYYSGNKKIDVLIQEMQSKINDKSDVVFEWIPYNQFDYIKEYCEKCNEQENQQCKICQLKYFKDWLSYFIQEMQLKINSSLDTIFEWIPYNQFSHIKEIGKGGFSNVYLAKWKDGPLYNS